MGQGLKKIKNESGMVIVEATFVFPVMFIILFFLIYMGNAHYEKAQIEALVVEKAIAGANYCADPLLETMKEQGSIPALRELDVQPYRYIFGGMNDIEDKISREVETTINGRNISLFRNMKPHIETMTSDIAHYNSYVVYATFSVEVKYVIEFPIRFLGSNTAPMLEICSRAEVPVDDTTEFIRNTDMVIDLFHGTKAGQAISDAFGKINDFITNFASR